jgi:choline/glycine/proline betaine transport protein
LFQLAQRALEVVPLSLSGGLAALQNVITALGFPFCALLVFMAVALTRALRREQLPGR